MLTVTGKFFENILGNKESRVEENRQIIVEGKSTEHSEKDKEYHSKKDIKHNSAEKSKLF